MPEITWLFNHLKLWWNYLDVNFTVFGWRSFFKIVYKFTIRKVEDHWPKVVLEWRGGGWWRPHCAPLSFQALRIQEEGTQDLCGECIPDVFDWWTSPPFYLTTHFAVTYSIYWIDWWLNSSHLLTHHPLEGSCPYKFTFFKLKELQMKRSNFRRYIAKKKNPQSNEKYNKFSI